MCKAEEGEGVGSGSATRGRILRDGESEHARTSCSSDLTRSSAADRYWLITTNRSISRFLYGSDIRFIPNPLPFYPLVTAKPLS